MRTKLLNLLVVLVFIGSSVIPASARQDSAPVPQGSFRSLFEVSEEVTKTVTPALAYPEDTVTYQISIDAAQSTPGSIYTITDAIPPGLVIDPTSIVATSGNYEWIDNILSWTVPAPLPEYDYAITTIDNDPLCSAGFVDLAESGISPTPAIAGNNVVYSAFTTGDPFDFYGVPYNGMGITDDGIIVFDPAAHYAGSPGTPQVLPDSTAPNNLLALLWQDMEIVYDAATGRGVSLAEIDANTVIVEFDEIELRSTPTDRYTFELIASRNPNDAPGDFEFVFSYHRLSRPLTGPLTVGVENTNSSLAQAYVNNANANNKLRNPFVVCLDRVRNDTPATLTYSATISAGPQTTIVNSAIIVTDEPESVPENADATLTIGLDTYLPDGGEDQVVSEGQTVSFNGSLVVPDLAGVPYPSNITWDFGDGASASDTLTPTHVYSDNGIYQATLTIGDASGVIGSDSVAITVNNVSPLIDLGDDAVLIAGDLFSRNGSFSDPGLDSWLATVDYGDGGGDQALTLDGKNFILGHIYPAAGVYTLTVTITDDDGGQDQASIEITVYASDSYIPYAGEDQIVNEGDTVEFDGSLAAPDMPGVPYPSSITWDFGDGTGASDTLTPSHVYPDNGVYVAALTSGDENGEIGSDSVTITVNNVPPEISLGENTVLLAGDLFSRNGTFTDPGMDSWLATVDYGDGGGEQALTLDGKDFTLGHIYPVAGVFTLTVTVTDDDGGQDQASVVITVYASDSYVPDAGEDQIVDEGDTVEFDGSLVVPDMPGIPYPSTITWDFGDGTGTSDTLTPTHVYSDNGAYVVVLTIGDENGVIGSDSVSITVNNVLPLIDLGEDASLFTGDTFSRNGAFTDPGVDTWTATVDYGDGSGEQGLTLDGMSFSLEHIYLNIGVYTLTVTVTDDDGGEGFAQMAVLVHAAAGYLPGAGEDQSVTEGSTVQFSGSLIDPELPGTPAYPSSIVWDFGDGTSATGTLTPTHVYPDNGDYLVTLTFTDHEGSGVSDTVLISVINAAPSISLGDSATLPQNSLFARTGSFSDPGADSWTADVDFGEGSGPQPLVLTGNNFSLQHTYLLPGEYTLTVTVTDDDHGVGSASINVQVTGYRLLLPIIYKP